MSATFDVEHDLVMVDEFDALNVKVKLAPEKNETLEAVVERQNESDIGPLLGKYPAKTHARKVAKELGVQDGLIYLPGLETQSYEDSDMGPQFRQRRYFYYLSGLDFAGCAVTYDIAQDLLTLWVPYSDPKKVLWFGTTPSPEECKAASEVDNVRFISTLERSLYVYLKLNPAAPIFVLRESQTPQLDRCPQLRRCQVHLDTARLKPAMDEARVIKTPHEVALIRRANVISSDAHVTVQRRLRQLSNEREIEALFSSHCLATGRTKHQSYPVIAGSGPNAASLHYGANDQSLKGRQLVVLDAGAEWKNYASDVTRTLPINGRFSVEGAEIYRAVSQMQNECIAGIRPGVPFRALHLHAMRIAVDHLLRLGVLRGASANDIFLRGTGAAFFPHGLGHHVGLEVHDVQGKETLMISAALASSMGIGHHGGASGTATKREIITAEMYAQMVKEDETRSRAPALAFEKGVGWRKLEPNMIVTVEPGIYFCREYIEGVFLSDPRHEPYIDRKALERYYPVGGVRIEDCILVTESGKENLTTAPKDMDEMLKIVNGN